MILAEQVGDGRADGRVGVIGEVGQRHPHRHLRCVETAAVHQHDALLLGEPPHEVDGLVSGEQPIREGLAVAPAGELRDVDRVVVAGVVGRVGMVLTERGVQRSDALPDDLLRLRLVSVTAFDQRVEREDRHHDLLWCGQTGGVVEGNRATVSDHPVDQLGSGGVEEDAAIALSQLCSLFGRQGCDGVVQHVVLVEADHAETPTRGAEELGPRVDQDRVPRGDRGQRSEVVHERPVDVVTQQDQVRAVVGDQVGQSFERFGVDRPRRRVGRVHDEERLDRRVSELVDLGGFVAPLVRLVLADIQLDELVVVEVRDLEVGGEDRRTERDRVALRHQLVLGE